jgi:thiol:disulfide interchange protein DsbG
MKNQRIPSTSTLVRGAAALLLGVAVTLTGCSRNETPAPTAGTAPAGSSARPASSPYEQVAQQGKGFTVGAMMSANPVYVLFDPQCPHCGHLWNQSIALHKKVKFVWIPITLMNPKSAPQGAALLMASNPVELMSTHEASLLAGTGGISASADVPADIEQAIKGNTKLFNDLRGESVPMIIAKHIGTGAPIMRAGAMDTAALAALLGVDAP